MTIQLLYPELTYQIRKVVFDVYNNLGPIFREATYEKAMLIGLTKEGIDVDDQVWFKMFYKNYKVGYYRVDLLVEKKIILELKAIPTLIPVNRAQIISYLKVTNKELGLLINFGDTKAAIESFPNVTIRKEHEIKKFNLTGDLLYPQLSNDILRMLFEVHYTLGPGFLAYIYRRSVRIELGFRKMSYDIIQKIAAKYHDEIIDEREIRLLIIEGKIALLVVAVNQITEQLKHKMWSYLENFNLKLGLIANFNNMPLEFYFVHPRRK